MMLTLLILTIIPNTDIAAESVDIAEVNHVYNEDGKHILDQLILWDWNDSESRFDIRAWRLLNRTTQQPIGDFRRGQFMATWQDGDTLRRVTAQQFRETWTQYDVELVARSILPKEQRKGLISTRLRR